MTAPADEPRHGAVFIGADTEGDWSAVWQSQHLPNKHVSVHMLTRDQAIHWARQQPAAHIQIREIGPGEHYHELDEPTP